MSRVVCARVMATIAIASHVSLSGAIAPIPRYALSRVGINRKLSKGEVPPGQPLPLLEAGAARLGRGRAKVREEDK